MFEISTDKSIMDVSAVHAFLTRSYWSEGIPIEIVRRLIENSLCWGVFYDKKQIGFARAITDRTTFAYIADVYILEEFRGRGYSKLLMKEIITHPELQTIRGFLLKTKDAYGLYRQFGFTEVAQPEKLMEFGRPDLYKKTK